MKIYIHVPIEVENAQKLYELAKIANKNPTEFASEILTSHIEIDHLISNNFGFIPSNEFAEGLEHITADIRADKSGIFDNVNIPIVVSELELIATPKSKYPKLSCFDCIHAIKGGTICSHPKNFQPGSRDRMRYKTISPKYYPVPPRWCKRREEITIEEELDRR